MSGPAKTPKPPYYAVIFTSLQSDDTEGYRQTARRMLELAAQQPGYLGVESAREDLGITVSYWTDLDSIAAWRDNAEHSEARRIGRQCWYSKYALRVCKVEKAYSRGVD
ncbi:MAG: heme-degrading monooxygenase HmoA [Parasphingorhabdus sp.]|jgi:heme-degrading monooxygenase HmoA